MRKVMEWLELGHIFKGTAYAAVSLMCLGVVGGAVFHAAVTPAPVVTPASVPMVAMATTPGRKLPWLPPEPAMKPTELVQPTYKLAAAEKDKPGLMEFKRPVADVDAAALDRQRQCLSIGIYYEARGETLKGQLAVAEVILNRVKSSLYPDNVCDVVYQGSTLTTGCQFSFTCDGMSEKPHDRRAWRQARSVAEQALLGRVRDNVVGKALFYHADYVRPRWASSMVEVTKVGRHIFYRLKSDTPVKKTSLASSDG